MLTRRLSSTVRQSNALSALFSALALAALGLAVAPTGGCSAPPPGETIGTTSQAESRDTFGLGEGRSGALTVTQLGTVINTYAPITGVNAGGTQITIGTLHGAAGALAPGDLLMIWRTGGLAAASASQSPFVLGTDIGGYEFGRVKSVGGSTVTFTNPLGSTTRYATGSQVIRVPEYTSASIPASTSVVPYAWDGTSGGVVIFFATGIVTNEGSIIADGAGFRGGPLENAAVVAAPNCSAHDGSDESMPCGGGHKGEGIDLANYSPLTTPIGGAPATAYGFGNYANGAGGGEARNAGGGGGGHFGIGGSGGNTSATDMSRSVGGLGGAPLSYDPASGFVELGGGGGAGDEDHKTGTAGGTGGGVILVRAGTIAGGGAWSAQGASVTATAGTDGSGGGGAGGAIVLFSSSVVHCGTASANGGAGGSGGSEPDGPGGGGGGGIVFTQATATTCTTTAAGGPGGLTSTSAPDGATAGQSGQVLPGNGSSYGGGACTPDVLGKNLCGGCVADEECAPMVCDVASNLCTPCNATEQGSCTGTTSACSAVANDAGGTFACAACNGDFGSMTAKAPCLAAALPHCVTSGAATGTCGSCLTGTDCTTAAAPACSTTTYTCAACNGDMGTTATATCPAAAAPYCEAAGTCGVCTSDSDCGTGHAGPRCDTTTGACGNTCSMDSTCGAGHWCDMLGGQGGVCQAQVPNGQPVPGGTCTAALGARACVTGVCSTTDNECGLPVGSACTPGDAGSAGCRSNICATSGVNAGKCEACNTNADCSGSSPVCSTTTNTCVGCTMSDSSPCKGETPLCDTTTNTCAACTGDLGTKGELTCLSSSAPFCSATGACSKCTNNFDCEGAGHAGVVCNTTAGTCGAVCTKNDQCGAGEWCSGVDGGSGSCLAKLANGAHLPTTPAGFSTCTQAIGMLVCASGICDAQDNECGPATVSDAGPQSFDATLPNEGVSIEGGALSCSTRGGARGSPAQRGVVLLGAAIAAACVARRRKR